MTEALLAEIASKRATHTILEFTVVKRMTVSTAGHISRVIQAVHPSAASASSQGSRRRSRRR